MSIHHLIVFLPSIVFLQKLFDDDNLGVKTAEHWILLVN